MKTILPLALLLCLFATIGCNEAPVNRENATSNMQHIDTLKGEPGFWAPKEVSSDKGPDCIIRNVLQDSKGYYWFATWQGIVGYDGKNYVNYTTKYNLKKYRVFSILEDKKGNMWFGTMQGGVYKFDGEHFTHFATSHGLAENRVTAMLEDKDGNIWMGTYGGLSCFDGQHFKNYTVQDGLAGNYIYSLILDKEGTVWIGTGRGVNCFDGKKFTTVLQSNGQPFHSVRAIVQARNGTIWVGCEDGLYAHTRTTTTQVKDNYVGSVLEDTKGNIWFSSGNTPNMVLYSYNGKTFADISTKSGKPCPQVFGLMEDANGHIWFGTTNGACYYNGLFVSSILD